MDEQQFTVDQHHTNKNFKKEIWEWAKALLIAVVFVFVIRYFLFSPFIVDGPSMQPNFQSGERLIVNKILYKFREPERGEVIVFESPYGVDYIKRVVALPGERVSVDGDDVYVNDEKIDERYIHDVVNEASSEGKRYNNRGSMAEITVPDGHVFVLGDNRSNSQDSRDIGTVEKGKIIGRADLIIWPLSNIRFISC